MTLAQGRYRSARVALWRMLLETISSPADLRRLDESQLNDLVTEIRSFIVDAVTTHGGHLGSNLGVIEITLALHRVFDSPDDVILWDTGHQSYIHKLVTGRREGLRPPPGGRRIVRLPLTQREPA
ncbi:MAG: hypothetical protein M5U19_14550 [Microthrixaceae bacterium]|nr:hypothetical protein [Microthrixaceae bacterium]